MEIKKGGVFKVFLECNSWQVTTKMPELKYKILNNDIRFNV